MEFEDREAIEEYARRVERALDERRKVSALWSLIVAWVVSGLVLTLAVRSGQDWLYVLGLVLSAVWTAGFVVARGDARWFRW